MTLRTVLKHVIGYLVGLSMFAVGIPFGLYLASTMLDQYLPICLIAQVHLRLCLSLLVAGVGIVFMVWSNVWLFFVGKGGPADVFGVDISPRSLHLVTSGPYRHTRNPMAFGALSFYLGLAIFLNSVICLVLVTALSVGASVYL
jgi:protein-S-isoprenylcysteine O-methyltransferase Ste14